MKTAIIRSSWMEGYGYRLDTKPYTGGALQMKIKLEKLSLRKDELGDLCRSITNIGRIKRDWVQDKEFGIPFLSGTDIQKADISNLSFISKRAVAANPNLIVKEKMTLITRSGTIGKMAYCRTEMAGKACTEDVLRVEADEIKILPGYLYAFMSSKFGVPLVAAGTYGAIIQHLEPEHIENIGVPRLDPTQEKEIHDLVEEAARLRSEASLLREKAKNYFLKIIGYVAEAKPTVAATVNSSDQISRRLDAHFHSFESQNGRRELANYNQTQFIEDIAPDIYSADRGPRNKVDTDEFGVPFLSSSVVFHADPRADFLISRNNKKMESFIIGENDLLIPRSGSIGGIIGRAVFPLPNIVGYAATEHLVHIRCKAKDDIYYLWAALASEPGYKAILSTAFGSAIPSLDCELIKQIKIPKLNETDYCDIVENVKKSAQLAKQAIISERRATQLLEVTIDKA